MSPILLLGAAGQVGGALLERLNARGASVVAPGAPGQPPLVDFGDEAGLMRLVEATIPAMVLNAAAYTAVDKAESDPDGARQVNAIAVRLLARMAAERGIPFVHYSTDYVYDGTASRPYREDDATNPRSVYGRTKLEGDRAVMEAGGAHLILRTSWVYGRTGHNFLRTMLRLFAEREEVRVVDDQRGAPTTSDAIADATLAVLDRIDWARDSGVYHCTCGGETTWYGFARAIHTAAHAHCRLVPITTAAYPTPACRPAYSVLDNDRLAERFGVSLPHWEAAFSALGDFV